MIPYKQLSLAEVFSDCKEKFENNKPRFLSLLEDTINLDDLVLAAYFFYPYRFPFDYFS